MKRKLLIAIPVIVGISLVAFRSVEQRIGKKKLFRNGPTGTVYLVVDKSDYELKVYDEEGWYATYPVVFGNKNLADKMMEGDRKTIVMINATGGKPVTAQVVPITQPTVYFKAECDFTNKKDVADFFYSLDGKSWKLIGTQLKMAYTLPHFMGYRFGLFNYATKNTGGFADFDFFHIDDKVTNK